MKVNNVFSEVPRHSYNTRKRRREMLLHNMPVDVHIMLEYPTRRRRIQVFIETKKNESEKKMRVNKGYSAKLLFALLILCWIWLLDENNQTHCVEYFYRGIDAFMKVNWVAIWNTVRMYGIDAMNTGYFMGMNMMDAIERGMDVIGTRWTECVEYIWLLNLNTDWTGLYISGMEYIHIAGMCLHFGVYVFIGIFMVWNV